MSRVKIFRVNLQFNCMNCYSMLAIVCGIELNKIEHMNETHNTVTENAKKKLKSGKVEMSLNRKCMRYDD